jgi:hypothetical protein
MENIDNSGALPNNTNRQNTGINKTMHSSMPGKEVDGHYKSVTPDRETLRSIGTDNPDPAARSKCKMNKSTPMLRVRRQRRRQHQRLTTDQLRPCRHLVFGATQTKCMCLQSRACLLDRVVSLHTTYDMATVPAAMDHTPLRSITSEPGAGAPEPGWHQPVAARCSSWPAAADLGAAPRAGLAEGWWWGASSPLASRSICRSMLHD